MLRVPPKYEDYVKLLYSRIWHYQNTNPHIDRDDIESEVNFAFVHASIKWDINKGKFSTYLYNTIDGFIKNLKTRVREETKRKVPLPYAIKDNKDDDTGEFLVNRIPDESLDTPINLVSLVSCINNLSTEAKKAINIVANLQRGRTEWSAPSNAISILTRLKVWSPLKTRKVLKEIKDELNNKIGGGSKYRYNSKRPL
jgi:hypothetical protein